MIASNNSGVRRSLSDAIFQSCLAVNFPSSLTALSPLCSGGHTMFIVMMNHSSAAHNTAMSLRSLPTLPRTHHTLNSLELNLIFITNRHLRLN